MKKLIIAVALCLSFSANVANGSWGEPVMDVCEKQITSYVEQTLQTTVEDIDFYYGDQDRGSNDTTAWVRVGSCSGYYVFDLFASELDCTIAHYGRIPNYISRVWPYGDCAN